MPHNWRSTFPGPPWPIFSRQGLQSGGLISSVLPLPLLSILYNPGKAYTMYRTEFFKFFIHIWSKVTTSYIHSEIFWLLGVSALIPMYLCSKFKNRFCEKIGAFKNKFNPFAFLLNKQKKREFKFYLKKLLNPLCLVCLCKSIYLLNIFVPVYL
jgi:hypothetical protein